MSVAHLSLAPPSAGMLAMFLYSVMKCSCRECESRPRKNCLQYSSAYFADAWLYPGPNYTPGTTVCRACKIHINFGTTSMQCLKTAMELHTIINTLIEV